MENKKKFKYFAALILSAYCSLIVSAYAQLPVNLSGAFSERLSETSFTRDGFFKVTPDGNQVIYGGSAGDVSEFRRSLFVVNVDGSGARKLLDNDDDGTVFKFSIASDSKYVVAMTATGLYSVSLQSGESVRLDNAGDLTEEFDISPNGKMVVFSNVFRSKIYSNSITGGQRTRLDVVSYTTLDALGYQINPDSSSVVMNLVEQLESGATKQHLVSVPIGGGPVVELLPPTVLDLAGWKLSPDGEYLVYQTLDREDINLYSVAVSGGDRAQLSIPIIDNQGAIFEQGVLRSLISPDSTKVVYSFKQKASDTIIDVYTVSITGGVSEKLTIADGLRNKLCGTVFSLTNSKVVYCLEGDVSNEFYLYSKEHNNVSGPIALNDGEPIQAFRNSQEFAANGQALLISDAKSIGDNFRHQLRYIPLDGGSSSKVFDYVSSSQFACSFNPKPFSQAAEKLAYCENVEESSSPIYIDGVDGGDRREIFKGKDNRVSPEFFSLNSTGENLVFVTFTPIGSSGRFATDLFSISTKAAEETCFPIKSQSEKVAIVCL